MTDFKFQFVLIISEVIRQIKIGLPLVLHTLAYGSYRYAEKLVILFFLGTIELGLYSLAEKIADSLLNLLMVRNKNISITISNELERKIINMLTNILFRTPYFFFLCQLSCRFLEFLF